VTDCPGAKNQREIAMFSHGFWIILPFSKMTFTLYLSLRKGLTNRLRLLGIE
jgi:hypothetical protein